LFLSLLLNYLHELLYLMVDILTCGLELLQFEKGGFMVGFDATAFGAGHEQIDHVVLN
jgi:hypothetical protein